MRTLVGTIGALAFAALAAFAGKASAGDAVKLLVEPPKNTTSVEAGDPGLDVQIVGIDATGARVGFGERSVETSANEGELILVEKPYKYRYVPPAAIEQATPVTLRAWLKQAPEVKGEASITVVLKRPFERLALVAPATSLALGTSMEIEVRGVRADGTSAAIKGQKITMTSEGVGTVEPTAATVFRFTAPAKSEAKLIGATAHLRAQLDAYPKVAGELSVVLTGEAPPAAPGGTAPAPVKPPAAEPQPPKNPPPAQPQPTAPAPAAGAEKDEGVLWPSGNVKLLIWRSKHKKGDEFPGKEREDLPPAGKPFVARAPYYRLRVEVERDDVRKVELEWYVGEKKGAPIHVDDQDKDGRLRTEKNKAGKTCAILEFETPDEKPLILNLLLTTEKGEVLKEEFVVQRGKDKDDDGSKDGKDKGGKGGKKNK
jgi:hypothetical protein